MVKHERYRKKKYETGIDPDLTKKKLEKVRDVMVEQEKPYLAQITHYERKVKQLCEAQGITTIQIRDYLNFMREVYSKAKRFSQATLAAAVQDLVNKWTSRGLLGAKLVEICQFFGVTPTAPAPPPKPFTLSADRLSLGGGLTRIVVRFMLPKNKRLLVWNLGGHTNAPQNEIYLSLWDLTTFVGIFDEDLFGALGIYKEGTPYATLSAQAIDRLIEFSIYNLGVVTRIAAGFATISIED